VKVREGHLTWLREGIANIVPTRLA
jgi:hypothetical protein